MTDRDDTARHPAQSPVRIVAWNILHGGGGRRLPEITLALLEHAPDIVVLTEFRTTTGGQIAGVLADVGLKHQRTTSPAPGANGICIASRWEIRETDDHQTPDPQRWLACHVPTLGLTIAGVHIPDASRPGARTAYWRDLIEVADRWRTTPGRANSLFVGDLNSGRHGLDEQGRTFTHTSRLGELATLGYRDIYRDLNPDARDFSWFSRAGNGFRLDGVWASAPLAANVRRVEYSQTERENRVSDHAILKIHVDFDGFLCGAAGGTGTRGTA